MYSTCHTLTAWNISTEHFLPCVICHTKQWTKHSKCWRNKTHLYSTCDIFLLVWMAVKKCVCFSIRLMLHSTSPVQRPLIKAPQLPCKLCIYIQHNYGILDPKQLCELINEWCNYEGIFSPTFYCLLKYFVHLLPLVQIKFAGGSNLCRETQTSLVPGGISQVSWETVFRACPGSSLGLPFSGMCSENLLREGFRRYQILSHHLAPIDAEELSLLLPSGWSWSWSTARTKATLLLLNQTDPWEPQKISQ